LNAPDLNNGPGRAGKAEYLTAIIERWAEEKGKKEISEIFMENGVPAGTFQTAADIVSCPHAAARRMILDIEDPTAGRRKFAGSPIKLSLFKDVDREYSAPPELGADNEEVPKGLLGFDDREIATPKKEEIIG
jgi:CoA:oxalate CoA-transferase